MILVTCPCCKGEKILRLYEEDLITHISVLCCHCGGDGTVSANSQPGDLIEKILDELSTGQLLDELRRRVNLLPESDEKDEALAAIKEIEREIPKGLQ